MEKKLFEKLKGRKAVSFDIFDTLIERKCGNPYVVFDIMEKRYNEQYPFAMVNNFRELRIQAEKLARQNSSKNEVSLSDIYESLATMTGNLHVSFLKDLEKTIELEQCVAIPEMVEVYHKIRECCDAYIISDMYLDEEFISSLLLNCGIRSPKKLYVSVEYNQTKRSRQLFKMVLRENGLCPWQLTHVGDNWISDYLNPKLLGIHSFIVK